MALPRARMLMEMSLLALRRRPLSAMWNLLLRWLGLNNDIPDIEIIRWKPIYLPCWQMDFSLTIQARLEGDDHSLVLTAVDIPFCGAGPEVAPLGTSGHGFWPMSLISAELQDYDPTKHSDIFQSCDVPEGEPVPSAQPMAFTLGPQDVLGHVNRVLANVRNDEVRFPGGNKTTLFAAYPYYAPMYLIEGRDKKVEAGSSITALYSGRADPSSFGHAKGFGLWQPEEGVWAPSGGHPLTVEIMAFQKPKIVPSFPGRSDAAASDTSSEGSDKPFISNPFEAARQAANSGSYDGAPSPSDSSEGMGGTLGALKFRALVAVAGELVKDAMPKALETALLPENSAILGLNAASNHEAVARKVATIPNAVAFTETGERNRRYIKAMNDIRSATEQLNAAKAIPSMKEGVKVALVPYGRSRIPMKRLDAKGLAEYKAEAVAEASKSLSAAQQEAEESYPEWARQSNPHAKF